MSLPPIDLARKLRRARVQYTVVVDTRTVLRVVAGLRLLDPSDADRGFTGSPRGN